MLGVTSVMFAASRFTWTEHAKIIEIYRWFLTQIKKFVDVGEEPEPPKAERMGSP